VAVSLVVLVLLIIFFIQNQDMISVKSLGWEGNLAHGVAFFTAAVGGGILVAIARARILRCGITKGRGARAPMLSRPGAPSPGRVEWQGSFV
jgi:uncharacterized integral membrane protein